MACLNCQGSKFDRGCCLSVNLLAKPTVAQRIQKNILNDFAHKLFLLVRSWWPRLLIHLQKREHTMYWILRRKGYEWGNEALVRRCWQSYKRDFVEYWCQIQFLWIHVCLMVTRTAGFAELGIDLNRIKENFVSLRKKQTQWIPMTLWDVMFSNVFGWLYIQVVMFIDFQICRRWSKRWPPIRKL